MGLLVAGLLAWGAGWLWAGQELPANNPALVSASAVEQVPSSEELFTRARGLYEGRNMDDAFVMYRRAAEMGHPEAQYMTGLMLSRGEGVPLPNPEEAARYYTLSAQNGFAKAQYSLGMLYYSGSGIGRDDAQAYRWFYQAALQGDSRAQRMLQIAQKGMKTDEKIKATAQAETLPMVGLPQ